jgi:predicted Zn-dependent protease
MEMTFIAYRGQIYRLSAGARQGRFSRYAGIFRGFARSFRSLRSGEASSIDEVRLRIAIVQEGEDLPGLIERTGNEWDLNRTAVINGLTVGDPLVAGTSLKIAVREPYRGRSSDPDSGNPPAEVDEQGEPVPVVDDGEAEMGPIAPGVGY